MAQELSKTKKRIESISSTLKITKAMELVATSKLKKWKDKMLNIELYLKEMSQLISSFDNEQFLEMPEFKKYPNAKKNLYIVITSSLGLCGGYNYNIYRFLNNKINKDDHLLILGSKGLSKYSKESDNVDDSYVSLLETLDYQVVELLKSKITEEYLKGEFKEVHLITTHYKNSLTFIPEDIVLLPLTPKENNTYQDIIFEPNQQEVLSLLIPKYLSTLLYGKLTEAVVCEHASRRNSMDSASDNAEELQEKLKIEFNKARQQAITQEITEVVSGANK